MISFFHLSALLTEGQRGGHCHEFCTLERKNVLEYLSFGFYRRGTVLLKPLAMTKGKTKLLFLMFFGNIFGV